MSARPSTTNLVEVLVVSDGFGFYAREVCAELDVPVLTNIVDWTTVLIGDGASDYKAALRAVLVPEVPVIP